MKQAKQTVSNCSWACLEAIVQAAFVLLALDNQGKPLHERDVQKIIDEQHGVFTTWKESHHKKRIKKHFDFLKDSNVDPNWKVSEDVVKTMQEIWEKNGFLETHLIFDEKISSSLQNPGY